MYCISCGVQLLGDAAFCLRCGAKQIEEPVSEKTQAGGLDARRRQKGIAFLDNWLAFVALGVLATITTALFAVGSLGFTAASGASIMQQFCLIGPLAMAALVSSRTGGA